MKTTKLLTILAPIASVGVIAPTISLTSCGGNTYSIDYGANINCRDKKGENYQKLENVQSAIKLRVNVETQPKDVGVAEINAKLDQTASFQNIYYELVANYAILAPQEFTLINWSANKDNKTCTFNLNGTEYKDVAYQYVNENGKVRLQYGNLTIDSYTYQYCKAI